MTKTIRIAAATALVLLGSCGSSERASEPSVDPPAAGELPELSEGAVEGFLSESYNHLARWSPQEAIEYFEIKIQDVDPSTGEWSSSTRTISTRFAITALAYREGDQGADVYVGGKDGSSVVIEKINVPPCRGGYVTDLHTSAQPLGVPLPPQTSLSVSVVGGQYKPHDRRACPPDRRVEIYRGTALSEVRGLDVDPEGRFLLAVDGVKVFQILTTANAVPLELGIFYQAPSSASVTGGLTRVHHATEGRKYLFDVDVAGGGLGVVLHDYDNDGVFDAVDDYQVTSLFEDPTPFEESLVHYWDETF